MKYLQSALTHGILLAIVATLLAYVWGLVAGSVMPPLSNDWDDIWRLQIWTVLTGAVAFYVGCHYKIH
jgi:hypothetical protein